MLSKFEKIQNIGVFKNYTASGDVSLKKINLIYGENGTGKTTLSNIFRSLATNDPKYINVKSAQAQGCIIIKKSDDTKKITFNKNSWNEKIPNIEIFDSTFIEENIHSGFYVTNNHKKKLANLILGENAINKNAELNQQKTVLEDKTKKLKEKFDNLKLQNPCMVQIKNPFDFFIEVKGIPQDIDEQIKRQEETIKQLQLKDNILKYQLLNNITPISINTENMRNTMQKTITGISTDVENRVKKHLEEFHNIDNAWLERGIKSISDNITKCPFCNNDISHNKLIETYTQFFNKNYTELKETIQRYKEIPEQIEKKYSEKKQILNQNKEYWNKTWFHYTKEELSFPEFDKISEIKSLLNQLIEQKENALLERIDDVQIAPLEQLLNELQEWSVTINTYIQKKNNDISEIKTKINKGNIKVEMEKLNNLHIRKCQELLKDKQIWQECITLCNEIAKLQKQLPKTREELDAIIVQNCQDYQKNINKFLSSFNAKFRLNLDKKLNYKTKEASYNYNIEIDGRDIPISGDIDDSFASPCLGNCLSEGDKTSLALAFFLAKLEANTHLNDCIILFDDPISSLDANRRQKTIQAILTIFTKASMVFVLSHDAFFLKKIYKKLPNSDSKTLELKFDLQNGSSIVECNILEKTKSQFIKDFFTLKNYQHEDTIKVAAAIRTYLEGLLRRLYPDKFRENDWLGAYINAIKSDAQSPLFSIAEELDEINNYSCEFHHSFEDGSGDVINEQELGAYVERTLKIREKIIS